MSSSDQDLGQPQPTQPTKEDPTQDQEGEEEEHKQEGEEEEGGEEEGECGFCLFMKGGGCKEAFIAWEDCINNAENTNEDLVEKCYEVTQKLTVCMRAHSDYYEPILRAEKRAEEELAKEIDKGKEGTATAENEVVGN